MKNRDTNNSADAEFGFVYSKPIKKKKKKKKKMKKKKEHNWFKGLSTPERYLRLND